MQYHDTGVKTISSAPCFTCMYRVKCYTRHRVQTRTLCFVSPLNTPPQCGSIPRVWLKPNCHGSFKYTLKSCMKKCKLTRSTRYNASARLIPLCFITYVTDMIKSSSPSSGGFLMVYGSHVQVSAMFLPVCMSVYVWIPSRSSYSCIRREASSDFTIRAELRRVASSRTGSHAGNTSPASPTSWRWAEPWVKGFLTTSSVSCLFRPR